MCAICGQPDYVRCQCEVTQPFCDQCEQDERCGQTMDADCVIYHPDNDKPSLLTCLGIPNNTPVSTILEIIDSKICQFFQVQIEIEDTPTVDLTLIGKKLKADVKVSSDANNQLEARSNGLYAPLPLESFKVKVDNTDAPDFLANQVVGGTDGIVTVSVYPENGLLVVQPAIDILCLLNKIKNEYLEELCAIVDSCKCFKTVMNLTKTFAPACPAGYTLNTETNQCEQINEVPPEFSGSAVQACSAQLNVYGSLGSVVYTGLYTPTGIGTGTTLSQDLANGNAVMLPLTNSVWYNNNTSTVRGPVNRTGLWRCGGGGSGQLGFIIPIQVPSTKRYYVGLSGDDTFRLDVNGTTIIDRPGSGESGFAAIQNYFGAGPQINFKFFNIYPIDLNEGVNYIYVIGRDTAATSSVFSAEIYDATLNDLINAQFRPEFNPDDPDNQANVPYGENYYSNLNLIFTTRCGRQPGTIFSYNGAENPCPAGYNLDTSGGAVLTPPCQGINSNQSEWICKQVLTVPFSGYNATLVFDKVNDALTYEIEMKPTGDPDSSYVPVPGSPFPNQAGSTITIQLSNLPSDNLTFRVRPNYGQCDGDWVVI